MDFKKTTVIAYMLTLSGLEAEQLAVMADRCSVDIPKGTASLAVQGMAVTLWNLINREVRS